MNNITIQNEQCVSIQQILTHYGYNASDAGRLPLRTLLYLIKRYYEEVNR